MEHVHQFDGEQSYVSVGARPGSGSGQRIQPDLPPIRTRHLDPNRVVQIYTFVTVSCCRCARPDRQRYAAPDPDGVGTYYAA